jgi:hypothetical protein
MSKDAIFGRNNIEACEHKLGNCLNEIIDMLGSDVDLAISLFKDFAKDLKAPKEPTPKRLPLARIRQFVHDYDAAGRGKKEAIIAEYAKKWHRGNSDTAHAVLMRARKKAPIRFVDGEFKVLNKKDI